MLNSLVLLGDDLCETWCLTTFNHKGIKGLHKSRVLGNKVNE